MLRAAVLVAGLLQVSHGVILKACGGASCRDTQEVPLNKCSPVVDVCSSSTEPIFYTRLEDSMGMFTARIYSSPSCAGAPVKTLSDACGKCIDLNGEYHSSVECPREPGSISLTACGGASCRKSQLVQLGKCSKVSDVCSSTPNAPLIYAVVETSGGKFDAKVYSGTDSSCTGSSQPLSGKCGKCLSIGNGLYHTTVDCASGGGSSHTTAIVLAVVGSLLALVIIAVAVYYFMVHKKRATDGEKQRLQAY